MRYDGGKGAMGVAQWIINQIPPHRVYIEPFLGGGAVLRLKKPARSSIVIERDGGCLAEWFRVGWPKLPDLRVIAGDGIAWLEEIKLTGDEFIYCDPPYLLSTRTGGGIYRHELSDAEHVRLLSILKRLRCSIAISGYWSPMYARALSGWRATQFITRKRNHAKSEEWLWMNYPEPMALHDYRYLGKNFRERERIKRKKNRWKARLSKMPLLERQVLVATLAEVDDGRSCNGKKGEVGRRNCPNCNYAMYLADRKPATTIDVGTDGNGDATRLHSGRVAPAEIA